MLTANFFRHREILESLSKEISSPFFYYDIEFLRKRMKNLREQSLRHGAKLFFAVKANPLSRILTSASESGLGFDIASVGEIEQLERFVGDAEIICTGPAKSRVFLESALRKGADIFIIESLRQLKDLDDLARSFEKRVKALLRVQLKWEKSEGNILGGDEVSAFGLPPEEWIKCKRCIASLEAVSIQGFHCFQWGNILDAKKLSEIWNKVGDSCRTLSEKIAVPFKVLDVGGGLGVPYKEGEEELDWNFVLESLSLLKERFALEEIFLEMGRYAIAPSGIYCCKVVDRKFVYGKDLLVLDGGINHLLRPALVGASFPCRLLRESRSDGKEFQLHGPLCTSLDCLGSVFLPGDVREGDRLLFFQCAAYGFTESMPYFLCHPTAAEVCFDGGETNILRSPKNAADYLC